MPPSAPWDCCPRRLAALHAGRACIPLSPLHLMGCGGRVWGRQRRLCSADWRSSAEFAALTMYTRSHTFRPSPAGSGRQLRAGASASHLLGQAATPPGPAKDGLAAGSIPCVFSQPQQTPRTQHTSELKPVQAAQGDGCARRRGACRAGVAPGPQAQLSAVLSNIRPRGGLPSAVLDSPQRGCAGYRRSSQSAPPSQGHARRQRRAGTGSSRLAAYESSRKLPLRHLAGACR